MAGRAARCHAGRGWRSDGAPTGLARPVQHSWRQLVAGAPD